MNAPAAVATPPSSLSPAVLVGGAIALVAAGAAAAVFTLKGAPASPAAAAEPQALTAPAPVSTAPADYAPVEAQQAVPAKVAAPAPRPQARTVVAKALCTTCGVIEAVKEVKQKGDASGVGAVGGAVVGGVLGHQVGKGTGKQVATVVGALGGGVAGHMIEKQVRSITVYEVTVRMEDGTVRTVTQETRPAVGMKVTVDGDALKARA